MAAHIRACSSDVSRSNALTYSSREECRYAQSITSHKVRHNIYEQTADKAMQVPLEIIYVTFPIPLLDSIQHKRTSNTISSSCKENSSLNLKRRVLRQMRIYVAASPERHGTKKETGIIVLSEKPCLHHASRQLKGRERKRKTAKYSTVCISEKRNRYVRGSCSKMRR